MAGSRTPLERIRRPDPLRDSVQGLDEAAGEVVRALEINRVRDGEIDLLANRFGELRGRCSNWKRALDEPSPQAEVPDEDLSVLDLRFAARRAVQQDSARAGQALARVRETLHQPWILFRPR